MEDKYLTIDEVSAYLKIPKSTIYKLSQRGRLPSTKVGKQLRFKQSIVDQWLTAKDTSPIIDNTKPTDIDAKNILLIDDDRHVLNSVATFLKDHGYKVQCAVSGEEAIKMAKDTDFDLVVTDVRMPKIDGIDTIQKIRKMRSEAAAAQIPELIITGFAGGDAEKRAEKLGIKDCIYKPFSISEFLEAIKKKVE